VGMELMLNSSRCIKQKKAKGNSKTHKASSQPQLSLIEKGLAQYTGRLPYHKRNLCTLLPSSGDSRQAGMIRRCHFWCKRVVKDWLTREAQVVSLGDLASRLTHWSASTNP